MPWFPDFVSAVELARGETRSVGLAEPVQQYFNALETGRTHELEEIWPGQVVIYDPREGEVRGHRHLRRFVRNNQVLWTERHVRIERVASTSVGGRAVVELLAHLDDYNGQPVDWPIAVVAESSNELSVVFRTYCSQWPVDGQRHIRRPVLKPGNTQLSDVVDRYLAALSAGDLDSIVSTFAPDAYFRESIGPHSFHRGSSELRSYFAKCFSAGGGLTLEHCTVTDDGLRCVLEFNCVRWGSHDLIPQAGVTVYERNSAGLLAAVRIYDEIEAPV
jgi:SnoaL-like domain